MNNYRKWFTLTLLMTIITLIFLAILTIVVDPFFHYHKPKGKFSYKIFDATYQNSGIARNFDYDSFIVGTSMTENFRPSYFKEVLGTDTVKLSYSGAYSKNYNIIMDQALSNNSSISSVFIGLDFSLLVKKDDYLNTVHPLPEYLYNEDYLDDVNYLFNKSVIFKHVYPTIERSKDNVESTSMDQAFYWHNFYTFSQNTVLSSEPGTDRAINSLERSLEEIIDISNNNLDNITPFFKDYPNTKFVLFIPPYSTLHMYLNYDINEIRAMEYSIERLLQYDNVELYFYGNNESITSNLYNYKDGYHYGSHINDFMVDSFKSDEYRLTLDNYKKEFKKYNAIIDNYNFDAFHGKDNPFINENNFLKYMQKLNDDRYIVLLSSSSSDPIAASDIFGKHYQTFNLDNSISGSNYLAVFTGGDVIYQAASNNIINYNDKVSGLKVEMKAELQDGKNYIETKIDGLKYTSNQPGVNIVVYDTELERVLDNITVNVETGYLQRK